MQTLIIVMASLAIVFSIASLIALVVTRTSRKRQTYESIQPLVGVVLPRDSE